MYCGSDIGAALLILLQKSTSPTRCFTLHDLFWLFHWIFDVLFSSLYRFTNTASPHWQHTTFPHLWCVMAKWKCSSFRIVFNDSILVSTFITRYGHLKKLICDPACENPDKVILLVIFCVMHKVILHNLKHIFIKFGLDLFYTDQIYFKAISKIWQIMDSLQAWNHRNHKKNKF